MYVACTYMYSYTYMYIHVHVYVHVHEYFFFKARVISGDLAVDAAWLGFPTSLHCLWGNNYYMFYMYMYW